MGKSWNWFVWCPSRCTLDDLVPQFAQTRHCRNFPIHHSMLQVEFNLVKFEKPDILMKELQSQICNMSDTWFTSAFLVEQPIIQKQTTERECDRQKVKHFDKGTFTQMHFQNQHVDHREFYASQTHHCEHKNSTRVTRWIYFHETLRSAIGIQFLISFADDKNKTAIRIDDFIWFVEIVEEKCTWECRTKHARI